MATLADGRVVSASSDGTLRVWAPSGGEILAVFILDSPLSVVAVGASGVVVAGDESGCVHFFDVVG